MAIPFDYILLFVSLIYGLALTHSLSCIAEIIQNKKDVTNYWLWWIWSVWFLLLSQGFWVSIYSYWHDCTNWNLIQFSFVSTQAALFYFCYYLFFNRLEEINSDLVSSFQNNKKIVFMLVGVLFLFMFVLSPIISNPSGGFIAQIKLGGFVLPILFWLFAFVKNQIANYIFAIICVIGFIVQMLASI
jgi:hypothetical protein